MKENKNLYSNFDYSERERERIVLCVGNWWLMLIVYHVRDLLTKLKPQTIRGN